MDAASPCRVVCVIHARTSYCVIAASGSETYRYSGYGHLLVESVCDRWTIKAVAT